jgi:hypothetical protein
MILKTESKPPKPKSLPYQEVGRSVPAEPKAIKLMTTPSTVGPRRAVDISYLGSVLSVNSVVKSFPLEFGTWNLFGIRSLEVGALGSDIGLSHPVTPCTHEKK